MGESMGKLRRTNMCGELSSANIGQEVILMGWVQKERNLGAIIFADLRDTSGFSQIVFDSTCDKETFEKAEKIRSEFVLAVRGTVRKREAVNTEIPTGEIEVLATELKILDEAETPPIYVKDDDNVAENMRLKYRYLDLRKKKMQDRLKLRANTTKVVRDFLHENRFCEVETPILVKPTPEGARDYIVPSRVNDGQFYALPQSPQLMKQILMVSGMDRYYQIAKCFRDEDLRADRQPEFTQIDIELSFVDIDDVIGINEKLLQKIFKEIKGIDISLPIKRLDYEEAMNRFGVDKPDLRFSMELKDISNIASKSEFGVFASAVENGGSVRGINVKGAADKISRKDITELENFAKTYGAKGLAWIKLTDEGISSPIKKFFSEDELASIESIMEAEKGDLLLFVADKNSVVFDSLGNLRNHLAKKLELYSKNSYEFVWITGFPLFEYDEENDRLVAKHHPFTHPVEEDIDKIFTEPEKVRAKAYDIVVNGYELGGGSIRINNSELQKTMFKALGHSEEDAEKKFGFLIEAFKYGAPPHGGIAFGLDRLIMLLSGTENIRDVIAFPKTQSATCLLTEAPTIIEDSQLEEAHIRVIGDKVNE